MTEAQGVREKMKGIFDLIKSSDDQEGKKKEVRLGLRIKLGDQETLWPLTKPFDSYEGLTGEIRSIGEDLELILQKAKNHFEGGGRFQGFDLDADMEPPEVWAHLSKIEDVALFVESFNRLDEVRRREVAEHVLTHCNIFSGMASVFSERFDNESGFMT
jgi:hypothetical protein